MPSEPKVKYTCVCGKLSKEGLIGSYNVGVQAKLTGFNWVPVFDGGSTWVCSECYTKAKKLLHEVVAILGTSGFSPSSFGPYKKAL